MPLAFYKSEKKKLKARTIMEKNKERKNVVDRRSIKLEHVLKSDYIPFLAGRPDRENPIGKDDMVNLEIVLNTSKTIDEFLQKL